MKFLYPFFILLLIGGTILAQADRLGTWGTLTVIMPGDTLHRWGGYTEVQVRTNEFPFKGFQYYEAKAGLSFDINKYFVMLLGFQHSGTYDYNNPANGPLYTENRLWEQLSITQFLSRIKIEHRYRVEQRFISNTGYKNTIRYRLNFFVPLNGTRIQAKTYYISVYDELFLGTAQPNFSVTACLLPWVISLTATG